METLTLTQALIIGIGSLATVVAILFAHLRAVDARQQKKLDECDDDRRELWQAIADMGGPAAKTRT